MKGPAGKSTEFERHPEGAYPAVCCRIIDSGTHWNEEKQKDERKILFGFETNQAMKSGDFAGELMLVFATYNFSMFQNSLLCKFIESWRGKRFESQKEADNFDLSKCLGRAAYLSIAHNGKYTNIQSIMPLPQGMPTPPEPKVTILIDQESMDQNEVNKLSEKMKARVLSAKERKAPEKTGFNEVEPLPFDDDIPF